MSAVRIQVAAPHPQSLKGPLLWSLLFHIALLGSLTISTILSHTGETWGGSPGGGGAVSVKLVGSVAGIPLPRPDVVTTNRNVDESKGLYKSEPQPKPQVLPPDTQAVPEFKKEKPRHYVSRPSKPLEDASVPPPNAIPFGNGGAPRVPYGAAQAAGEFTLGSAGAVNAGMGFSGPGGGGDFASRFSWYVDAVQRRVSSNWYQGSIPTNVNFAPRAVLTFDILRNGSVVNIQILQSSGNQAVDRSVISAIQGSNPFQALPAGYNGSKVSVEFWFDYSRH